MRAAICSSEIRTAAIFGLLNSESNWADEVANLFLLLMQVLVEQEFACLPRGATYYASSSFRSNDTPTTYIHGRAGVATAHSTERGSAGATSCRARTGGGTTGGTRSGE